MYKLRRPRHSKKFRACILAKVHYISGTPKDIAQYMKWLDTFKRPKPAQQISGNE